MRKHLDLIEEKVMANPAYMKLIDSMGQPLLGDSLVAGREGAVEILAFQHHVFIPTDKDTGSAMGTRKHEPLIVTTQLNPVSPEIFKACTTGKNLQQVQISWYRINDLGHEDEYYRHTLMNVKVVAIKPVMHYVKNPKFDASGHLEEWHFRYETIRVEYLDGNIAAQDSWNQRSVGI